MFVSYAQNFEDVLLHRALKGIRNGIYIDIGAHDPIVDSVSMAFYRLGWRGVHVEPLAAFADALRKQRPDETVIEAAVGEEVGNITFYEIVGTGLSTANADAASRHVANGLRSETRSVSGIRLAEILDAHRDRDIHWLKIDVEGQERSVIRSWQPSEVRPWIVVVESVDQFCHQDNSVEWEPELLAFGYTFAYFDGLNRFYVSSAHPELAGSFGIGPNLFDDFALSGTSSSPFLNALKPQLDASSVREAEVRSQLEALSVCEAEARAQLEHQRTKLQGFEDEIHRLAQEIVLLRSSTSWRVTAPFRTLSRLAAYSKRGIFAWLTLAPGSRPRRVARSLMSQTIALAQASPFLKSIARQALAPFPTVAHRIRALQNRDAGRETEQLSYRPRPGAPTSSAGRLDRIAKLAATRLWRTLLWRLVPFLRYRAPRIYDLLAGSPTLRIIYTRLLRSAPVISSGPPAIKRSILPRSLRRAPSRVDVVSAVETQFGDSTAGAIKRAMGGWRKGKRVHA